jgi:hypothetical protein
MIFKIILGIHGKASNLAINAELGTFPACFISFILMFKYYNRLKRIEFDNVSRNSLNRWYLKSLSKMSKDDNSNFCLIEFKVLFKDLLSFLSSIKANLNREFLDSLSDSTIWNFPFQKNTDLSLQK